MANIEEEKTSFEMEDDIKLDDVDFASMVEQSLTGIKEGEVVPGRVVELTPVSVIVDIGYKAEGEIAIEEFYDDDDRITIKPGDSVDVLIESYHHNGEEEVLVLSRRRAGEAAAWEKIEKAYRDEGTVTGYIVSRVKGGLRVDVGVPAFLPGSQVDLRPVRDMDSVIGRSYDFRVLKYSRPRRNVVLSRRVILEELREEERKELLGTLADGQVLPGVVKNVVKYGAFIDLGGMDGLLHVSDMSWGRINHPGDLVKVGDEIEVKVLKFDREKQRISLGLKQLSPDPWQTASEKYPVDSLVTGKVVNLVDYGAFVEVEPGLEGLIHVTEMSWSGGVHQADQVLAEGDEIEAMVINIDPENRKLALSLKRTQPDPWEEAEAKFPPGTVIEGQVKTVTDFGVFIGLDEGIDGLVHKRDLSWSETVEPEEAYQAGDSLQAMILSVDTEKKRVALGVRQLSPDPWPEATDHLSLGAVVEGTVTGLSEDGVSVEVREGVVGTIPAADEASPLDDLAEGDQVEVRIVELHPERHFLALALIPPSSVGD